MTAWLVRTEESRSRSRIGGAPDAPADFRWPVCKQCGGAMQFLAQLALPDCEIPELAGREQSLLLFQCQNDPGMCDEWDPQSGGNAARLVPLAEATRVKAPASGETRLMAVDPVGVVVTEPEAAPLGRVGGEPEWIQADETPTCVCGTRMRFVVQLSPEGGGGINFGDAGEGYGFVCDSCPAEARFLWQCG